MELFNVEICLLGTWCHDWPLVRVAINDHTYYDGPVENQLHLAFDVPSLDNNHLSIQHYGKQFGQNGQWDTVSDGYTIVQDRAAKLMSFCLDEVELRDYVVNQCWFVTETGENLHTDYYGFNGTVAFEFQGSVYDWIIDHIVKSKSQQIFDLSQPTETSMGDLFNYQQDLLELSELEYLLAKHAHLFGQSS